MKLVCDNACIMEVSVIWSKSLKSVRRLLGVCKSFMEHIRYNVPKSVINSHTFYYRLLCKVCMLLHILLKQIAPLVFNSFSLRFLKLWMVFTCWVFIDLMWSVFSISLLIQVQWVWINLVLHGAVCVILHQAGQNQMTVQRMTVLFVWSPWLMTRPLCNASILFTPR